MAVGNLEVEALAVYLLHLALHQPKQLAFLPCKKNYLKFNHQKNVINSFICMHAHFKVSMSVWVYLPCSPHSFPVLVLERASLQASKDHAPDNESPISDHVLYNAHACNRFFYECHDYQAFHV